jgi:hypothetical protein
MLACSHMVLLGRMPHSTAESSRGFSAPTAPAPPEPGPNQRPREGIRRLGGPLLWWFRI